MSTWIVTFGQKYRREPHSVIGMDSRLPDGWLTVEADTRGAAVREVQSLIGAAYAFLYEADEIDAGFFPLGNLGALQDAVEGAPDVA